MKPDSIETYVAWLHRLYWHRIILTSLAISVLSYASASILNIPVWGHLLAIAAIAYSCWKISSSLASSRTQEMIEDLVSLDWFNPRWTALETGDVIATRNDSPKSVKIRKVLDSPYSHVALYLGNGSIAEAVAPRSKIRECAYIFATTKKMDLSIYRLRQGSLDERRLRAEARFQKWNLYSFAKALAFVAPWLRKITAKDAVICSEYIALVYDRGGVKLHPMNEIMSPADFCNGTEFRRLGQAAVRPMRSAEVSELLQFLSWYEFGIGPSSKSMRRWVAAILYSMSPLRSGWRKPMEDWRWHETLAYYIMTWVKGPVTTTFYILLHRIVIEPITAGAKPYNSKMYLGSLVANSRQSVETNAYNIALAQDEYDAFGPRSGKSYPAFQSIMTTQIGLLKRQRILYLGTYRKLRRLFVAKFGEYELSDVGIPHGVETALKESPSYKIRKANRSSKGA